MLDRIREPLAFHRTGLRLLGVVHRIDRALIPVMLVDATVRVGALYASLILTARLVDALAAGSARVSAVMAACIVACAFLASCVRARCERRATVGSMRVMREFTVMLREKAMSLSYETMEDPKISERIAYVERTASMQGNLGAVAGFYRDALCALLNMLACVGLVVALCLAPGRAGASLSAAASPAVSALLLLAALGWAVAGNGALGRLRGRVMRGFTKDYASVENRLTYLLGLVLEDRRVPKVARIYDMRGMLMRNLEENTRASIGFYDRWFTSTRRLDVGTGALSAVFVVASYAIVAVKVLAGAITVGSFTTYAGALAQFGGAYATLCEKSARLRECCGYLGVFLDLMDMEDPRPHGTIPVEKRDDGLFELAFEHVSFRYPGTSSWALRDVSLKLDTLHRLAVVGPNGAGKTTFIKLLVRLYDPTEGRITLNGVDIRKYDEDEYRDLFAVVFQDFRLFAFPVWENLAAGYARDDERMWAALAQAGAAELVRALPQGLDTLLYKDLGDGVMISGGEAQKLALARALYKDAPLVILDEPTAALDPISEAEVYEGFDRMVEGRTAVYISHRMSSCRFCDRIVVFDGGRIAEAGSHEDLLAAGGLYASLWNAQASYYVDGEKG
ncbi:ABC transporter ATP-binding protein [Olsenella uli]|uniref:ABC transporter ATP-binding protein n=1 Tax=Olsenella uli TaxID=133926 RepID=UPI00195886EF|nr:ABC transporter ATP-binding protein [Olsenella uli]MBM6816471.1 ABC transporter ATP-binding protein [Olsenella uli]